MWVVGSVLTVVNADCVEAVASELLYVFSVVELVVFAVGTPKVVSSVVNAVLVNISLVDILVLDGVSDVAT